MRAKRPTVTRAPWDKPLLRRKMLRGLGAMAVSGPALAALGCSDDSSQMNPVDGVGGSSGASGAAAAGSQAGAAPGGAGGGVVTAGSGGLGAGSAGTASAGNSGSGAAGANAAGASAGSTGAAGNPATAGRGAAGSSGGGAGANAAGGGAGAAGSSATVPMFQDAASCTVTTMDIEGPFYIDEAEIPNDISMVRNDIREGGTGVEFRLYFRMLDARKSCAPIPDAELYIWHCNADGLYSGFSGQDPSKPYSGSANPNPSNLDRFCRGIQSSGSDGVASFTTVYPGWYAGRPIHIHLMARLKGSSTKLILTQLYFPADFTLDVHRTEPAYMARAASMPVSSRTPPSGKPAMPTMTHTPGLVVGTLNVIVNGA